MQQPNYPSRGVGDSGVEYKRPEDSWWTAIELELKRNIATDSVRLM